MKATKIEITVYEAGKSTELTPADSTLLHEAINATKNAYAPYSKFNVGAAVLLDNGEIIYGSNQENAAYPSGLCAERVALFYASSRYPNVAIKAIAINSTVNGKENHDPVYPCGDCRQVLLECENRFGRPIKVIMGSASKIHVVHSIKDLLPLSFVLKRE
ncbi:MAG: cytidine deaminase [Prevotellaceae bacterium]|jgi:cytidine deaminase|nr:cytidine deaminase [Prevotellaceae bacterium]